MSRTRPQLTIRIESEAGDSLGALDLFQGLRAEWRPTTEIGDTLVPSLTHPPQALSRTAWPANKPFVVASSALAALKLRETKAGRIVVIEARFMNRDGLRATDLRIPLGRIEAIVNGPTASEVLRGLTPRVQGRAVMRPGQSSYKKGLRIQQSEGQRKRPDEFYREVADLYASAKEWSTNPAQELANANDVPLTTIHRWIKEARRRGLAAPGHQRNLP